MSKKKGEYNRFYGREQRRAAPKKVIFKTGSEQTISKEGTTVSVPCTDPVTGSPKQAPCRPSFTKLLLWHILNN
jgi:hypothetical protein